MNYQQILHQTIVASILAGKEILKVYDTKFDVEYKDDNSPLTLADKKASDKIIAELKKFDIPILSEEGFHDSFEITEFHPSRGQFVATAQIERSPIIFMARTTQLNQLQRSLLAAVFQGLQNP